jgi:putative hydrolase of the HAD superfamily
MKFKYFLFDLDDTLYRERDFVFSGYQAVGRYTQNDFKIDISDQLRTLFLNGRRGDLFTPVLQSLVPDKANETYVKQLVSVYREHLPAIKAFPEAHSVLETLRSARVGIGLVTDGWPEVQKSKIKALKIENYFGTIVCTGDINGTKSWKPAKDGFLKALRDLNAEPGDTVYVGDNPLKDFIGARGIGLHTVRYKWAGSEHEMVNPPSQKHSPDAVIETLTDLLKWV